MPGRSFWASWPDRVTDDLVVREAVTTTSPTCPCWAVSVEEACWAKAAPAAEMPAKAVAQSSRERRAPVVETVMDIPLIPPHSRRVRGRP